MRKSLGTVALTLLLGVMIGAILGEVIGLFLPKDSMAETLFVKYKDLGFHLDNLNLIIIELSFGIKLHFNLMSVIGVFIASQMLRWYR